MARRLRIKLSPGALHMKAKFEEAKHKRDNAGKFADKPGAGNDAPKKGKPKATAKLVDANTGKTTGVTDDDIIKLPAGFKNPKKPGTASYERFAKYKDGMTVKEYIDAVGDRKLALADLAWDRKKGYLSFEGKTVVHGTGDFSDFDIVKVDKKVPWFDDKARWAKANGTALTDTHSEASYAKYLATLDRMNIKRFANNNADVSTYTGHGYTSINGPLRKGEKVHNYYWPHVKTLDDKVANSIVMEDTTMWRGIGQNGGLNDMPPPGDFVDLGFSSVSFNPQVSKAFAGQGKGKMSKTLFKIRIPKGAKAAFITRRGTTKAGLSDEAEVILARGTRYKYVNKAQDPSTGQFVIELEVVKDDGSLFV